MIMDKAHADALCAIIALGFIGQNEREDRTGRTLYIYDTETDRRKHDELWECLHRYFGIDIRYMEQNATASTGNKVIDGRKIHPFIYALPYGNENEPQRKKLAKTTALEPLLADITQITETAANSLKEKGGCSFNGAYVGGFIDYKAKELSLIGPSSLYVRDRMYLTEASPSPDAVASAFTKFSDVTKRTKTFLKECAPTFKAWDHDFEKVITAPALTDELISEGTANDGDEIRSKKKLLSSCHGLITSMYYHSSVNAAHLNDGVCIEFSLSKDVNKSASCIPCAIFAAAQGAPASQVHFGRGDFWNLPREPLRTGLNPKLEKNWRSYVTACFVSASKEIINIAAHGDLTNMATIEMAALVDLPNEVAAIPNMFLDALTFEGPFHQKILSSFC